MICSKEGHVRLEGNVDILQDDLFAILTAIQNINDKVRRALIFAALARILAGELPKQSTCIDMTKARAERDDNDGLQ